MSKIWQQRRIVDGIVYELETLGGVARIVVSLLNPKVAIFFLAFLPQFVVPGAGPTWAQLYLRGILIALGVRLAQELK